MTAVSGEDVTVIVPAYNEAAFIAETIRSLQGQSLPGVRILVVDDGSADGTGRIAQDLGATVVRPPANTGSKAGAQSFGLAFVTTPFVVAVDADTTLAEDALEIIIRRLAGSEAAAVCGYVLPRRTRTLWELGRHGEYLFALGFYKRIQNAIDRPLIASGCFSAYRTEAVRAAGGWSDATVTEDVDLTWTFYARGETVLFEPEALSYPLEPATLAILARQLKRWSHGLVQNLRRHRDDILGDPRLRSIVSVMLWDASAASVTFLLAAPLAAALYSPWFLLVYVIDLPVLLLPILMEGARRGGIGKAFLAALAVLVLRIVNSVFFVRAAWSELARGRRLTVYEKGH